MANTVQQLAKSWGSDIESALTILDAAIENRDLALAYGDMPHMHVEEIRDLIVSTFAPVEPLGEGAALYKDLIRTLRATHDECALLECANAFV